MFRRVLAGACFCIVVISIGVSRAGAALPLQGKVGPHQVFGGLVNGDSGVGIRAPIHMACFGAVRPGQKGHPLKGQTVELFHPEAIRGHFGNTGDRATSIVAFFGTPPPVATPGATTVTFHRYGVTKPIPTSLLLPCDGTGTVHFVPVPKSPPTSHDATVRVAFIGQP